MSSQSWGRILTNITAPGTLYNTYTTAKSMLASSPATAASAGVITLPPNFFQLGAMLEFDIEAAISNRITGPDTFTAQVMVGNVIAFSSGAINLTTTAHTTLPARGVIRLSVRGVGNGTQGLLEGQSFWEGQMIAMAASLADGTANSGWAVAPNTAPANGTGFDSTVVQTLDFYVAQSVSNAGNGFQIRQYKVVHWGNDSP